MKQKCAKWGCTKDATYDKPLCVEHYKEWADWLLGECTNCQYNYDGVLGDYPMMCDSCISYRFWNAYLADSLDNM